MTHVKSLVDRANDDYVQQNGSWIDQVFKSYSAFSMSLRSQDNDVGHQYHFTSAVLNTRIGEWTQSSFSGKTCGENGGKTAKGLPCKKRRPWTAGARCILRRSSPCGTMWATQSSQSPSILAMTRTYGPCQRVLSGLKFGLKSPAPMTPLSAIDQRSGSVYLVSGTRVWDDIILDVKDLLNLPPEAHVRINKRLYGADPLWTVEKLLLALNLPLITQLATSEGKVESGYLLGDYGLRSGGCLDLGILC